MNLGRDIIQSTAIAPQSPLLGGLTPQLSGAGAQQANSGRHCLDLSPVWASLGRLTHAPGLAQPSGPGTSSWLREEFLPWAVGSSLLPPQQVDCGLEWTSHSWLPC